MKIFGRTQNFLGTSTRKLIVQHNLQLQIALKTFKTLF